MRQGESIEVEVYDEETGRTYMVEPPGCYEVCPRCEGRGRHVNPAIDGNGITQSEMDELGPDFERDYFRGVYDVPCHECAGDCVVWSIDWEKWERESPDDANLYQQKLEDDAEYFSEREAERRMGA